MGFDLYSTGNHKSQKGEYFRNNVWWWRPLWDWTYEQCQDIITQKQYEEGQYNDCSTTVSYTHLTLPTNREV